MNEIPGVEIRELTWHEDARGALAELYRESWTTEETRARQVYVSESSQVQSTSAAVRTGELCVNESGAEEIGI